MRKDVLAAGGKSAQFAAGKSNKSDKVFLAPGILSSEGKTEIKSKPILKVKIGASLTPLYDRIIVRRREAEDFTPGGILIPESGKDAPCRGEVLSIGCGRITEDGDIRPLLVKPGDKILFGKYSGTEVELAGEKLLIMREEEVLCIE